ncbi:MAG TPA: ABC-three component system protein [Ktedonobacteraceae bacterium]|nr:ABC-three component system protein [Ktedonobacteraceae bacterium]
MDKLRYTYYELKFENAYLKKGGNEFQDFFSEIMEKCHPGDFQRVRPWGNVGDRKNDGYLSSQRILFQVYAPNEMKVRDAIAKIDKDFHGALLYWRTYFDTWVFVHNSRRGLAPEIEAKLFELSTSNAPLKLKPWGFEALRQRVFTLDEADLASLLGPAPSSKDMFDVRYENVQEVLSQIERHEPPLQQDIRPVPADKLKLNHLSTGVQNLLFAGMQKSDLVGKFFNECYNPTYGDEIAEAFNQQYKKWKRLEMDADSIFGKLLAFTGGSERGSPMYEAAVLAVLAYLFEQCDIFERSMVEVVP